MFALKVYSVRVSFLLSLAILVSGCSLHKFRLTREAPPEIVAELDVTPSGVAVSKTGRVFATVSGLRRGKAQLIEVTGKNSWKPFPNKSWNRTPGSVSQVLNTPVGILVDHRDWLWVIDSGSFLTNPQPAKVVAFDVATGELKFRYNFPKSIAPRGSLLQDLTVSPDGKFVYIADSGGTSRPGIVVLNTITKTAYRYDSMRKFEAEDLDLVVRGETVVFKGKNGRVEPARFGLDPISLSVDGEMLYFGSLNGTSWYRLPTKLLRKRATREDVSKAIELVGRKPLSDGALTDAQGNHYFASVTDDSVVRLSASGETETVLRSDLLEWPESLRFGPNGWIYISVSQINRSAAFANGKDSGMAPYRIVRFHAIDGDSGSTPHSESRAQLSRKVKSEKLSTRKKS